MVFIGAARAHHQNYCMLASKAPSKHFSDWSAKNGSHNIVRKSDWKNLAITTAGGGGVLEADGPIQYNSIL